MVTPIRHRHIQGLAVLRVVHPRPAQSFRPAVAQVRTGLHQLSLDLRLGRLDEVIDDRYRVFLDNELLDAHHGGDRILQRSHLLRRERYVQPDATSLEQLSSLLLRRLLSRNADVEVGRGLEALPTLLGTEGKVHTLINQGQLIGWHLHLADGAFDVHIASLWTLGLAGASEGEEVVQGHPDQG